MVRSESDMPIPQEVIITPDFTKHIAFTSETSRAGRRSVMGSYQASGGEIIGADKFIQIFITDSHEVAIPPQLTIKWTVVWKKEDPNFPPAVKPPLIPLPFRSRYTGEILDGREMMGLDN